MKRFFLIGVMLLFVTPAFAQPKPLAVTGNLKKDVQTDVNNLNPSSGNAISTNALGNTATLATTTGPIDLADLWKKIVAAVPADLTYAKALADNIASPNSKLRSQCYAAVITANAQANGINLKDSAGNALVEPSPALVSEFEKAAELVDNLQPSSPVMSGCAAAANALAIGTSQLVNGLVTGAALKAVSGGILP